MERETENNLVQMSENEDLQKPETETPQQKKKRVLSEKQQEVLRKAREKRAEQIVELNRRKKEAYKQVRMDILADRQDFEETLKSHSKEFEDIRRENEALKALLKKVSKTEPDERYESKANVKKLETKEKPRRTKSDRSNPEPDPREEGWASTVYAKPQKPTFLDYF